MTTTLILKRSLVIAMLALPLTLSACGQESPGADDTTGTETTADTTDTGSVDENESY